MTEVIPEVLPPAVLRDGKAMQRIQTQYATAVSVQKPRDVHGSQRALLVEADLAGDEFYYGWTVKDKDGKASIIEGPSIQLATAAARCWGNCAIDLLPVQETADSWVFTATFVDLETGFTLPRQFRQSKRSQVYGKLDAERKDDIRFQIGQSKAIRNVVRNALPSWFINKALDQAKGNVRKSIEDAIKTNGKEKVVDRAIAALAKFHVKEEQILIHLGVADRKAVDVDGLVMLRGDIRTLEEGQDRAEDIFPPMPKPPGETKTEETEQSKADRLAAALGIEPESPATPPAPAANGTAVASPVPESPSSQAPTEHIPGVDDPANDPIVANTTPAPSAGGAGAAGAATEKKPRKGTKIKNDQFETMKALAVSLKITKTEYDRMLRERKVTSAYDLTWEQAQSVINEWKARLNPPPPPTDDFPFAPEPERQPGDEG